MLQDPVVDKVINTVKSWMLRYDIPAYDEIAHRGLLRHVVTRVGFKTGEIMVVLVTNGREVPHVEELVKMLLENCGA